ncbi:MAG: hypothetical protein M3R30_02715 [Candidatus Eremiobacteraeota bacterium]|nr:hypothetical protein [Candidatus Eremiobacteraeota bacterium]
MLSVALRLAAAIVCAGIALCLWDVGTRSPFRAALDIAASFRARRNPLGGIVRTLAGIGYAGLAVAFAYLALPENGTRLFSAVLIGAFLTGLCFEALIGPSIRWIVGIRPTPTDGSPPER